jgi:SAM-dependent methyltransferase
VLNRAAAVASRVDRCTLATVRNVTVTLCTCCRSTRSRRWWSVEGFDIEKCNDCGSLFLRNPPADLSPYYGNDYYSFATPKRFESQGLKRAAKSCRTSLATHWPRLGRHLFSGGIVPTWLDWLPPVGPRSQILDVGSGAGRLVAELHDNGLVGAIGYDPYAAPGPLVVTDWPSGPFDVVMFNHSLEHLERPVEALRYAADLLRSSRSTIVIRLPLADSRAAAVRGASWMGLDPPRHMWVPSDIGLRRLADQAGMSITKSWRNEALDEVGDAGGVWLRAA